MEKIKTTNNNEIKIPLLNFFNYNHWRLTMIDKLIEKKLDIIVWGNENDIENYPSECKIEALLFIYKHLNESLQYRFRSIRDAKILWNKVIEYFEHIKSIFITFIRLKCKLGDCRNYFTEFFNLIENLRIYEIKFDKYVIIELFLSKLPIEFDSILSIIYDRMLQQQQPQYEMHEIKTIIICYETILLQQQQQHQQQQQLQQQLLQQQQRLQQYFQHLFNNNFHNFGTNPTNGFQVPNFVPQQNNQNYQNYQKQQQQQQNNHYFNFQ